MEDYKHYRFVCSVCGNDDISVDAYAAWDEIENKFVLNGLADGQRDWCNQCGDRVLCILIDRDIHNLITSEKPEVIEKLLEYMKDLTIENNNDYSAVVKLITKYIYHVAEKNNMDVKDKVEAALVFMSL